MTGDFPEFGSSQFANYIFRRSHLAGTFETTFRSKDLNICETVSVPAIPEVISVELAGKVRARMQHRRVCNKEDFRKYHLTGFVRCGHCGRFLTGSVSKGQTYYRHHSKNAGSPLCVFYGIREDAIVPPVLDYLFRFITDEPAYEAAIAAACPDPKEREVLEQRRRELRKSLERTELEVRRLVNAIAKGVDPSLLIQKQDELQKKRDDESKRVTELEERLASIPTKELLQREAMRMRLGILARVQKRNWRKLSYEDIRRFLIFVFGENPGKNGDGIVVSRDGKKWLISFRGRFALPHDLANGRPILHSIRDASKEHTWKVKKILDTANREVGHLKLDTGRRSGRQRSRSSRATRIICAGSRARRTGSTTSFTGWRPIRKFRCGGWRGRGHMRKVARFIIR